MNDNAIPTSQGAAGRPAPHVSFRRVVVLGAGAWGTALARLLALSNVPVVLWGHSPQKLSEIASKRVNEQNLPGIGLPPNLAFEPDLHRAVTDAEVVLLAVPSKAFREVTQELPAQFSGLVVSVTKGIEYETGFTMCGIIRSILPSAVPVALSGPTLAMEVAQDNPSAIVAASPESGAAETVQALFHRPSFRVYTSTDLIGVELGGALKNVIALAAGVCDGLGFGDNSKAALTTRAIVEIRRVGVACGAQAETFSGLSGLGDLTVTCFSRLSRNRAFGERLGKGESADRILASTHSVAEGVPTARSAFHLARRLNVETPIVDEVYAMLYKQKDLKQAVQDLTGRDSKAED